MVESVVAESPNRGEVKDAAHLLTVVLSRIDSINGRIDELGDRISEVGNQLAEGRQEKEWYTTTEVAKLKGVAQYTVQERWCNQGRIECEKEPETGKWRIPGREFMRLERGGALKPKEK